MLWRQTSKGVGLSVILLSKHQGQLIIKVFIEEIVLKAKTLRHIEDNFDAQYGKFIIYKLYYIYVYEQGTHSCSVVSFHLLHAVRLPT